ncbi:hypothetical protein G7Y89_g7474 [Cudoniella acicularis]|uniref:ADP-ribosylation factor GTPase-activating protein n=1 Tax=Cudoniella acicularis TaxID=354080 RepID=A0A8H4RK16_9HELO|nr:hypothetical protein G7Y89_g7474 [Cudoniella acicularis]
MGNVGSKPDDGAALCLRDQTRLTISSLTVTNSRRRTVLNVVPNAFPATRISATRDLGDNSVVEYVQDPEPSPGSPPSPNFILKLNNDDELTFRFTFVIRQTQQSAQGNPSQDAANGFVDTIINGLTYVSASTAKEVETLVTREFHADPNLHKNANVQLVGDFSTGGSQSVSFEWSWKWRPPKPTEDRGGGWRNHCSFVEYDQRAHRLNTLASFSFWVSNYTQYLSQPNSPSPPFNLVAPPKLRVPSSQSMESRLSSADTRDYDDPPSPNLLAVEAPAGVGPVPQKDLVKVDVSCQRPGEDMSATEDGPLFRATMKALEQKTGNMRQRMKKVLRKAEAAHMAQIECNDAIAGFMDALREASSSNANAVQPALEHYFDKIAREILNYEKQNTVNLQKVIIDPITKLYNIDIKQAEAKKRDFEEESKDYYAYVSRYLGQRQDSLKTKKRAESDSKYQTKRRNFELKRFDYSSFMQDLHGGRKEQEVLSHLTKFADAQTKSYLATAKKVEEMLPQLDALSAEVQQADKEFQYQRTEREEKRRNLEKSTITYVEPETVPSVGVIPPTPTNNGGSYISDSELGRSDSTASTLRAVATNGTSIAHTMNSNSATEFSRSPGSLTSTIGSVGSPGANSKFRGIRDLEEKDHSQVSTSEKNGTQRKEGLLWALSRPGSHADPRGLNKQAWHKFWIVLDAGKLSEYSNWKQRLDLHMEPIDLRMASVREARNAERRFCFEVITPQYKRVYQATSEEDMNNWISAINNAIQSAVEGRDLRDLPAHPTPQPETHSIRRDIGSILTGKSSSMNYGNHHPTNYGNSTSNNVFRRTTVGARPAYNRQGSNGFDESPDKLLQLLRDADQGNCWCADCGSGMKTEWVSINLAIILCIECSGIHRSLGTHISKVRSLTLDINSFTTDIVELLLLVGNRVSNMVWEARLDPATKPTPQATREERLRFITAKYVDRAYVEPISSTLSRYGTADDTLLAAIKKNDIQQVIYALALKANPNVADKSRGTHSVFLALAAADPASPSPVASPARPDTAAKAIAFPIAEMLVQNGAEIPSTMPAFPLSRSAALYIEQKSSRGGASTDTLGALPSLGGDRQKEREARLQKRALQQQHDFFRIFVMSEKIPSQPANGVNGGDAEKQSDHHHKKVAAAKDKVNKQQQKLKDKKDPPGGYDSTPIPPAPDGYTVRFIFHRAENLPMSDLNSRSSDPYIHATVTSALQKRHKEDPELVSRTPTIHKNTNPEWNCHWTVAGVPSSGFKLKCRIYDEDPSDHDDRLGNVTISVGQIGPNWKGIRGESFDIKKRMGSKRAYMIRGCATMLTSVHMDGTLYISAEVLGKSDPPYGRMYTIAETAWTKHYSPMIGRIAGTKAPGSSEGGKDGKTEKYEQVEPDLISNSWAKLTIAVSKQINFNYKALCPLNYTIVLWNSNPSLKECSQKLALHHQHARVYNFSNSTEYGIVPPCSEEASLQFLKMVHYDEGGRIFTYVVTLDGLLRFTETGKEFGIDLLSKHTMHSNVNIYIACSGEFFVRRLKHPEKSVDSPNQETHPNHDIPGGPPNAPPPKDPRNYELVIDNDSGTYRPKGDLLPLLQKFLSHNFPGLHVVTKECTDDKLAKMKEGQRERKKKEGKNLHLVQNSDDEISSSDEEQLNDPTKKTKKAKAFQALENPKGAMKDLIPGEKGREEREERETEDDKAEINASSGGI